MLYTDTVPLNLSGFNILLHKYHSTVNVLDKHATMMAKKIIVRKFTPKSEKMKRRRLERDGGDRGSNRTTIYTKIKRINITVC